MNLKEYQEKAASTSLATQIPNSPFVDMALNLMSYSGKAIGKIKKLFRDKQGKIDDGCCQDIQKNLAWAEGTCAGLHGLLEIKRIDDNINGNSEVAYPVFGLYNEAGEVAEKINEQLNGTKVSDEEFKKIMSGELGDVLWYVAETCTRLGISLDDVATANIQKLLDRKERGVIKGSGDNR